MMFYYYVDYEEHDRLDADLLRFHAQWRRENPTEGWGEGRFDDDPEQGRLGEQRLKAWTTPNLDGEENYVILEAQGRGHYVGCNLNIDVFERQTNDWYGEGDDMIFIDGETLAADPARHRHRGLLQHRLLPAPGVLRALPRHHGLQRHRGLAVGRQELDVPLPHRGPDPLPEVDPRDHRARPRQRPLQRLLSTAYWYQTEPHAPFPPLLPVDQRLPRPDGELRRLAREEKRWTPTPASAASATRAPTPTSPSRPETLRRILQAGRMAGSAKNTPALALRACWRRSAEEGAVGLRPVRRAHPDGAGGGGRSSYPRRAATSTPAAAPRT